MGFRDKLIEFRVKFWDAITPKKRHYFLEKAGIKEYPDSHWGGGNSFRGWKNAIRQTIRSWKYGINPRDCWDLDDTFYRWLYEQLCMLLKDTNADLDNKNWVKYEHKGKEYSEREYIEYLKSLCLEMINFDECEGCSDLKYHSEPVPGTEGHLRIVWDSTDEEREINRNQILKNLEYHKSLMRELFDVFYELMPTLWW